MDKVHHIDHIPIAAKSKLMPLSFAQERLWFFEKTNPNSSVYNMPFAYLARSALDRGKLQHSINQIVSRHSSLRTLFLEVSGKPFQLIQAELFIPLHHIESSKKQLANILNKHINEPFDLETGPLLRTLLIELDDSTSVFLVILHHIIADGWSMGVFFRELMHFYNESAITLIPPRIQLLDYTMWQHNALQSTFATELSYWKKTLSDADLNTHFAYDHKKPSNPSYTGGKIPIRINEDLTARINALSKQYRVSPFMLLISILSVLVYVKTNAIDQTLGTVIANRNHADTEQLIGYLANTIPLRLKPNPNMAFNDFLAATKDIALEAYQNQNLPFNLLIRDLHLYSDLGNQPLIHITLVYQNTTIKPIKLGESLLTPKDVHTGTSKFDISFIIAPYNDSLTGYVEYSTECYLTRTIQSLVHDYLKLLEIIIADPTQPISSYKLDKVNEEVEEKIKSWKQLFDDLYQQPSEATAIKKDAYHGWTSSFTQEAIPKLTMLDWVEATVQNIKCQNPIHILEIGCGTGLLVEQLAPSSETYTALDFSQEALDFIRTNLLYNNKNFSHVTLHHGDANRLTNFRTNFYDAIILNSIVQYFPSETYLLETLKQCETLLSDNGFIYIGDIKNKSLKKTFHQGVQLHRQKHPITLDTFNANLERAIETDAEQYFDASLFDKLKEYLHRPHKINIRQKVCGFTSEMSSFRFDAMIYFGEPVIFEPNIKLKWAPNLLLQDCFSDKEQPIICVAEVPNMEIIELLNTLKLLSKHTGTSLLNFSEFKLFPDSSICALNQLCKNLAEKHSNLFIRVPNKNKPLTHFDAFFIPKSTITKMANNRRWMLAETQWQQKFKENEISRASVITALRQHLEKQLPTYMIPTHFVILDSFPLTSNGKVDRKKLLEMQNRTSDTIKASTVASEHLSITEKIVYKLYVKLLKIEKPSRHDNFFTLGGHSLLITQLIYRLRKHFKIQIPLQLGLTCPSIASLARAIDNLLKGDLLTDSTQETIDINIEALLPADIQPRKTQNSTTNNTILLTGATGFLGAFLLYELCNTTDYNIVCLVRAENIEEAKSRVISNLEYYKLSKSLKLSRIAYICGDLTKKQLGLTVEQYQWLAKNIHSIYHNGALVNFSYPYSAAKPANVEGTIALVRLACLEYQKTIHFISTLSVFSHKDINDPNKVIMEQQFSDTGPEHATGYTVSKWVAERILAKARMRGIPVSIYRMGRISGSTESGACQRNDLFWQLVKFCVETGYAFSPEKSATINLLPADKAAEQIIELSLTPNCANKNFHLCHPKPFLLISLFHYLEKRGYQVKLMPIQTWKDKITQIIEADPNNKNFQRIIPTLQLLGQSENSIHFDQSNLEHCNSNKNITPIDENILEIYFNFFDSIGFFEQQTEPADVR